MEKHELLISHMEEYDGYLNHNLYVVCTNCGADEETSYPSVFFEGDLLPSEEFYNLGWRATVYGNCYCPKCAKKKLKTKREINNE